MKKIFKYTLAILAGASVFTSCAQQLEVSNPSVVDGDFVFSSYETGKTVMLGAYNSMVSLMNSGVTVNYESIGSDVERCSVGLVAGLVGAAQLYGAPYELETFDISDKSLNVWGKYYKIISICNQVIYNIENFDNYSEIIASVPNDWSDLLGQAYALRATAYYDLARLYGDMIYMDRPGVNITELSSRDYIMDKELENLMRVEGYLYSVGENNHLPDQMTRNYVDGLIGRICFLEAGYQTRRTDLGADFYKDGAGNTLTFEVWGTDESRKASYGRRSDWKKFYETALPYLKKGVEQPAGVTFTTVDPRSDKLGRTYGNPFQYYFEQVTNKIMADETIYEVSVRDTKGSSRIAYNWGRGSNGASPGYPPKANAQINSYPEVFYGMFDPQDMRRDASLGVTGSTGTGAEALYNYANTNRNTVGIGMNKYDLNRVENPDARQLYSGINYVVMRQADMILMLAEAYAQTGDASSAATELRKVHDRAFPESVRDQKYNELLAANGGDILEAIYDERALEFISEGLRRRDLIRTGKLPEVAVEYRKQLVETINDVKTQGYHVYENGNEFPAYVWTKLVDGKDILGYRLTAQTPESVLADDRSLEYSLLVPGYRGQHDSWETVAEEDGNLAKVTAGNNTNLSIMGLFRHIEPGSAEALALEADGYVQTGWGVETYMVKDADTGVYSVNPAREAMWSTEFFIGYSDADFAAKKAPIHFIPMAETVCVTTGNTNGYGFKSAK